LAAAYQGERSFSNLNGKSVSRSKGLSDRGEIEYPYLEISCQYISFSTNTISCGMSDKPSWGSKLCFSGKFSLIPGLGAAVVYC
jgi:hypothetical protein